MPDSLGGMSRRFSFSRVPLCAVLSGLFVMTGALVGAVVPSSPAAAAISGHDNTVYAFGSAPFRGSTESRAVARPIAAMAPTADGQGYWMVGQDGAVYTFHAPFYGGINGFPLNRPVVGITATPSGNGYWIVTGDGIVAAMGGAKSYGSMAGKHLNKPIKALIAGPGGKGYWLLGTDGGVFSFGSAKYHGSTGGIRLNQPVVGMAASKTGNGYWLVARDGGVFTFGDAVFHGSTGNLHLTSPVVGMARDFSGKGYWVAAADGGVFTFGDAGFKGSARGLLPANRHVRQITNMPVSNNGYRLLAIRDVPDVALVFPGNTGAAVKDVQTRLLRLGFWMPGANGVFDSNMQQAVWAFQKANRIPRTGVVDAATQKAFRTASRPRPRSTTGYRYEIDKTRQIAMIASNGYAKWTLNTSTGSDHGYDLDGVHYTAHTPEGQFTVIRQVNGPDKSPLGSLYRPKYFTWSGIAVHGYTSVPPYPASHGCTRVSNAAMDWIWATNVLPIGTSVWVYV